MVYKNEQPFVEDEQLSPSFENAIVLRALEKIDPCLPPKVKKDYGHQMTGNVTLRDVWATIFENIDNMLEYLETVASSKAIAAKANGVEAEKTSLNYASVAPCTSSMALQEY